MKIFKILLITITVYCNTAMALPDTIVDTPTYDKLTGIFTCQVHNVGVDPIGVVTIGVRYTVDGTSRGWGSATGPLAAGASVAIGTNSPTPLYIIPDGQHTIDYWVDDLNRFAESNETNNHFIYNVLRKYCRVNFKAHF